MYCPHCTTTPLHHADIALCPECASHAVQNGSGAKKEAIAWENLSSRSVVSSLGKTIVAIFFNAPRFFSGVSSKSLLYNAILFGLTAGSIGIVGDFISHRYSTLFWDWLNIFNHGAETLFKYNTPNLLFAPFYSAFEIFLVSCYIHLMLLVTRTRRVEFKTTFISVCYMQATFVFCMIPVVGSMLAFLWYLYLMVVGIGKVHSANRIRVGFAIFLPILFSFLLLFVLISLTLVGAIFAGSFFSEFSGLTQ